MAHLFESGFCVRDASWHRLEDVISEDEAKGLDWSGARQRSGMSWEPEFEPMYRLNVRTGEFELVDGGKFVVRNDTGAILGPVTNTFELITHEEMGQIMEPVLSQPGVRLDTMGVLDEGRSVYATVLLDEPFEIRGDVDGFGDPVVTLPYFAILNNHVGKGACKGLYTQVRVVCANTSQAADMDGDRHGAQFSLRHTSGVKQRLEEARQVVDGCRAEASRWRAMAEALALIPITDDQQLQFLSEFIPEPPKGITSDKVQENIGKARTTFLHILRDSATNCAMQHTGLGLVNAATEYLDHVRGFQNRDTYLRRQILSVEPLKAKAVSIVRELVAS